MSVACKGTVVVDNGSGDASKEVIVNVGICGYSACDGIEVLLQDHGGTADDRDASADEDCLITFIKSVGASPPNTLSLQVPGKNAREIHQCNHHYDGCWVISAAYNMDEEAWAQQGARKKAF